MCWEAGVAGVAYGGIIKAREVGGGGREEQESKPLFTITFLTKSQLLHCFYHFSACCVECILLRYQNANEYI